MLAQGIIRQLRQMDDCLTSLQVLFDNMPDILVQAQGRSANARVVEPSIAVKTCIQPNYLMSPFQ
jgi:hypothetical protein